MPGTRQQPGPRLMKAVCQDWDLISSGLVQWSGLRTDNLFQPPKCDRYYILMLPNLNCISQRSPARMRLCAGWCNEMIILFGFLFYLVIYQKQRPAAPASQYLVSIVWATPMTSQTSIVTRFTVEHLSSVLITFIMFHWGKGRLFLWWGIVKS